MGRQRVGESRMGRVDRLGRETWLHFMMFSALEKTACKRSVCCRVKHFVDASEHQDDSDSRLHEVVHSMTGC